MKKPLAIVLIIAAVVLGYLGFTKLQDNRAGIKIGDLEISAEDKGSTQQAYVFFGLAAVALIAGVMVSRGKA